MYGKKSGTECGRSRLAGGEDEGCRPNRTSFACGSQTEFAETLGISKRTLEQWEQGRRKPSGAAKQLLKIAERHPEVLNEVAA